MAFSNSGFRINPNANMVVGPGLRVKNWRIYGATSVMGIYDKSRCRRCWGRGRGRLVLHAWRCRVWIISFYNYAKIETGKGFKTSKLSWKALEYEITYSWTFPLNGCKPTSQSKTLNDYHNHRYSYIKTDYLLLTKSCAWLWSYYNKLIL